MKLPAFLLFFALPVFGQNPTVGSAEPLFEKLDANSDGELSAAELESAGRKSAWLRLADQDGNGTASKDEVLSFLQSRRVPDASAAEPKEHVFELPADSPVQIEGIRKAAQYSAAQNGFTFLVAVDGRIVYERYESGWIRERPHRLASGTKSFSAAILAAVVQDGLLSSIEEKVSDTVIEWKGNKRLSEITYRELLNLSSGIDPGDNGKVPAYSDIGSLRVVSAAGENFRYGPSAFQVFGEAVTRKLAASEEHDFSDPLAYLEARVFGPIGLEYSQWRRDENGKPHLPSGAFLTAGEWWKYGEFLRQAGAWEGKQLVDAKVLKECLTPSKVNAAYGITVWFLEKGGKEDAEPSWGKGGYMAAGAGKQRLYVLPDKGVVVVRQGDSRKFEDAKVLNALFSRR
ncbi:MAG: serine hydrolase [Verrucomicrobiales bacterium]|nr:serine hydrolase [Verrucomicrobiales bacterium]